MDEFKGWNFYGTDEANSILNTPEKMEQLYLVLQRVQSKLMGQDQELSHFLERIIQNKTSGNLATYTEDISQIDRINYLLGQQKTISYPRSSRNSKNRYPTQNQSNKPPEFENSLLSELYVGLDIFKNSDTEYSGFLIVSILRNLTSEQTSKQGREIQENILKVISGGRE